MMSKVSEKQVALTLGSFAALVHLVWSIFIAAGIGQALVDWIIGLHMVSFQFTVGAFNLVTAITLIVVTFVLGSLIGYVLATIWNKFSE